ncbi:helix-turn-helix domain-containing protein [Roseomonas fluvialis]|uniref:HTH crp-type domain-containing protein n=1 Tax=Roseomonas fluvialis TaxID=1750527 RepID=A0ABN6NXZ5_9PROT|nr:helix-turn-helix domain-containing protein [Roseomonas fluvialis]BDG70234.1 hypothetical protein Rmf_01630 [Roseomonas fluvialis]
MLKPDGLHRIVTASPKQAAGGSDTVEVAALWRAIETIAGIGGGFGGVTTIRVWAALLLNRERSTGVVRMDRADVARLVGISPGRMSRILTALAAAKMIERRREHISGKRGPGRLVIVIL